MITSYVIVVLAVLSKNISAQYLLAEYAPNHDNYRPANYHFSYGVSDPTTGDHKHHWEKRQGDHVIGEYGLLEPDGATRIVQYTADPHNGFQAVVKRIENQLHIPQEQYTHGHVLYGGQYQGLYNKGNIPQYEHPQENIHLIQNEQQDSPIHHPQFLIPTHSVPQLKQQLPITVYQNKLIEEQLQNQHIPQENNQQYYLNQYAGNYNAIPANPFDNIESRKHPDLINHDVEKTNSEVAVQNAYSTLHHQPNYDEIDRKYEGLPEHVIKNIQNQYNNEGKQQGSVILQSQGFSNQENTHSVVQNIPRGFGFIDNNHDKPQPTPKENIIYVTSEAPIQSQNHEHIETSTLHNTYSNVPQSTTENYGYIHTTTASPIENQHEQYHSPNFKYTPNVQVIPNGQNIINHEIVESKSENVAVNTEQSVAMNPLLMNLMLYIKDHMPLAYKDRFETVMKPYLPISVQNIPVSSTTALPPVTVTQNYENSQYINDRTSYGQNVPVPVYNKDVIISSTPLPPVVVTQNYDHNPYLSDKSLHSHNVQINNNPVVNREVYVSSTPLPPVGVTPNYEHNPYLNSRTSHNQEYNGDFYNSQQNENTRKIYYELDPASYQQSNDLHVQNNEQKESNTVFQVVNENGYNLKTPNFYQPTDPNSYNNPNKYQPNSDNFPSATQNDFIWNAGDYSAPRDPEVLVRQLNTTCVSLRFNQTNEYEERDQDPHIWNSGDYTALRAEEELIRSVNITCDNFTNDASNNFASGINLWQYCSFCLDEDQVNQDQDVNIVNKEIITDGNGKQIELFYSATKQQNNQKNDHQNNDNQNAYVKETNIHQPNYADPRSNAEIAGILLQNNEKNQLRHNSESTLNPNILALIKTLNYDQTQGSHSQPIYLDNREISGLYKRNIKREKRDKE